MRRVHPGPFVRKLLIPIVVVASLLLTSEPAAATAVDEPGGPDGPITITRGDEIRTSQHGQEIHCDGGGEIYVNHWFVIVTGECDVVAIKASGAETSIESTEELDIYGDATMTYVGRATEVDVYGNDNLVALETSGTVDDSGNDNFIDVGITVVNYEDQWQENMQFAPEEAIDPDAPTTTISDGEEARTSSDGATIQCDGGGDVYVYHDSVTITGDCQEISIRATGVTVTIEETIELDVLGHGSVVTATTVRELEVVGNGNDVTLESVREIDFEGDDNTVAVASGTPDIDDEGTGNSVT